MTHCLSNQRYQVTHCLSSQRYQVTHCLSSQRYQVTTFLSKAIDVIKWRLSLAKQSTLSSDDFPQQSTLSSDDFPQQSTLSRGKWCRTSGEDPPKTKSTSALSVHLLLITIFGRTAWPAYTRGRQSTLTLTEEKTTANGDRWLSNYVPRPVSPSSRISDLSPSLSARASRTIGDTSLALCWSENWVFDLCRLAARSLFRSDWVWRKDVSIIGKAIGPRSAASLTTDIVWTVPDTAANIAAQDLTEWLYVCISTHFVLLFISLRVIIELFLLLGWNPTTLCVSVVRWARL